MSLLHRKCQIIRTGQFVLLSFISLCVLRSTSRDIPSAYLFFLFSNSVSIPEYPWDNPDYVPTAFVVQKIHPTVFVDFYIFSDRVRGDMKKNIILCVLLGVFGLLVVLLILAGMSNVLTQGGAGLTPRVTSPDYRHPSALAPHHDPWALQS